MNKNILKIIISMTLIFTLMSCGKKDVQVGSKTFDVSKNYVVAISQSAEKQTLDSMRKGFVVGMKNLGFLEDVNVTYLYENAKNSMSFAEQIATAYKEQKIDLMVTIGDTSTIAMTNAVDDVPIVFIGVADAERLSLVDRNLMPTKNATGVMDSHLIDERLKYITLNYPDVKRLGIIYNSDNKLAQYDVDYFKLNATSQDIDIYTVSIKKADDIEKALDNIMPKVDAIVLVTDYMVDGVVPEIVRRAKADGKEVFGDNDEHEQNGAEVVTSRDYQLVGEKGAELAVKIIKNGEDVKTIKAETVDFRAN